MASGNDEEAYEEDMVESEDDLQDRILAGMDEESTESYSDSEGDSESEGIFGDGHLDREVELEHHYHHHHESDEEDGESEDEQDDPDDEEDEDEDDEDDAESDEMHHSGVDDSDEDDDEFNESFRLVFDLDRMDRDELLDMDMDASDGGEDFRGLISRRFALRENVGGYGDTDLMDAHAHDARPRARYGASVSERTELEDDSAYEVTLDARRGFLLNSATSSSHANARAATALLNIPQQAWMSLAIGIFQSLGDSPGIPTPFGVDPMQRAFRFDFTPDTLTGHKTGLCQQLHQQDQNQNTADHEGAGSSQSSAGAHAVPAAAVPELSATSAVQSKTNTATTITAVPAPIVYVTKPSEAIELLFRSGAMDDLSVSGKAPLKLGASASANDGHMHTKASTSNRRGRGTAGTACSIANETRHASKASFQTAGADSAAAARTSSLLANALVLESLGFNAQDCAYVKSLLDVCPKEKDEHRSVESDKRHASTNDKEKDKDRDASQSGNAYFGKCVAELDRWGSLSMMRVFPAQRAGERSSSGITSAFKTIPGWSARELRLSFHHLANNSLRGVTREEIDAWLMPFENHHALDEITTSGFAGAGSSARRGAGRFRSYAVNPSTTYTSAAASQNIRKGVRPPVLHPLLSPPFPSSVCRDAAGTEARASECGAGSALSKPDKLRMALDALEKKVMDARFEAFRSLQRIIASHGATNPTSDVKGKQRQSQAPPHMKHTGEQSWMPGMRKDVHAFANTFLSMPQSSQEKLIGGSEGVRVGFGFPHGANAFTHTISPAAFAGSYSSRFLLREREKDVPVGVHDRWSMDPQGQGGDELLALRSHALDAAAGLAETGMDLRHRLANASGTDLNMRDRLCLRACGRAQGFPSGSSLALPGAPHLIGFGAGTAPVAPAAPTTIPNAGLSSPQEALLVAISVLLEGVNAAEQQIFDSESTRAADSAVAEVKGIAAGSESPGTLAEVGKTENLSEMMSDGSPAQTVLDDRRTEQLAEVGTSSRHAARVAPSTVVADATEIPPSEPASTEMHISMDTSGGGDNTSRTEAQADSEDLVVSTAHPAALHHESDNNVGAAVLRRANELGVSLDAPAVEDPTVVQDVTRETGIDPTFLAALPEDVRREVIGAHFDRLISTSSLRGSDGVMANPNLSTELNISSASSAMNEALTGNSVSLGRDFLHALPPDIRTEILEAEVRILSVHNNQAPSNADASGGGNASAVVIERGDGSAQAPATGTNRTSEVASPVADANAVFFSSLPDDLRREILATSDDSFISSLPPALAEEARHLQGQRNAGMRGSLLGIAASLGNGTASGTTELGLPALVGSAPNRVHRRLGSTDFGALYGIMDNADDLSALLRGRPQGRDHGDESGGNGNDRHRDPSSVTTVYRLRARSSGLTGSFRSALAMNGGRGGGYGRRTAGLLGASNVTDAYDPMLADYGRPGSSSAQFRTSTAGMTDRNMYNHWLTSLEQHQRYPFPLAIQPDSERAPRIGDLVTRIFNGDSAGLRVNAGSGHVNGIEHAHRSPGRRAPAISGSNVKRHGEAGDDAPTQRVKEFMSEEAVVCMLSLLFQPGSFSRASSSGRSNSFSMISVNRVVLFVSENERLCRFVLVVLMELVEVLLGIPQEEMVEGALPFLLHEKIRLSTAAGLNAHVVSERAVVAQRALDLIHHLIMYNESAVRQLFSEDISSEKGDRMASNTMFVRLLRLLEPRFSGGGPSASGFWSSLDTLISIISHASSCPALTISPEKVQKSTQSDAGPAEATSSKASSGGRVTSQDGNAPPQFSIAVPMLNAQEVRNLVSVLGWTACSEKTLHRVEKVLKRLCCICDGDPPNLNPNGVVAARVLKRELCALADRIGIEYDRFRTRFCNASGSSSSGSEDANTFAVRHELIRGFASDAHEHEVQFLRFAKTFASLDEHAAFAKLVAAHDDDDNDAKDDFLLDSLWEKLGQVLEILESSGIDPYKSLASFDVSDGEGDGEGDDNRDKKGKKSDAVPALSRVSPVMEAFFVMQEHRLRRSSFDNAPDSGSGTLLSPVEGQDEKAQRKSADDSKFDAFVDTHRAAINALLRLRPGLLEGSMKCVLEHPQHLDFENKRAYFRSQIRRQRASAPPVSSLRIHVRREQVFEDSYHQLRLKSAAEMKGHLHVEFVGEEGIDVGGVTREWYAILARRIFDPNHALFVRSAAKTATYQPNTLSYVNEDHLAFFRFVGRIFAKAIYDGALLDAYFTRSFYKHILGVKPSLHDLEPVDPDYYKSMVWILENDITDVFGEGDLTMSAEYDEFGANRVVDLIPNGRHVAVTNENKRAYVQHVTDLRLTKAIEKQIEHFLAGFYDIVPREQIALFNECELELLMSGTPEIDVADLKANVEYSAGYSASRAQIVWFWRSVALMDKDDLARLIMFVTGTSKVPLEGFAALPGMNGGVQKFQIHRVAGDSDRLPSAHTCFNQLDLPEYSSFEKLHDRLLIAIREGAEGFGYA